MIIALSTIGLFGEITNKKEKLSKKIAAIIGYIIFMALIILAINKGW